MKIVYVSLKQKLFSMVKWTIAANWATASKVTSRKPTNNTLIIYVNMLTAWVPASNSACMMSVCLCSKHTDVWYTHRKLGLCHHVLFCMNRRKLGTHLPYPFKTRSKVLQFHSYRIKMTFFWVRCKADSQKWLILAFWKETHVCSSY